MNEPKKELTLTRTFDASAELVFKLWTEPEMVKQWWGPNGITIDECEIDLTVGGRIYIVMVAGEEMGPYKGTRWPMEGIFTIVETNARLAYNAKAWTEGQEEATTIENTSDITFEETEGKTNVTIHAAITKAGPGAQMAVQGMEQGFNQQMDKLAKFIETQG